MSKCLQRTFTNSRVLVTFGKQATEKPSILNCNCLHNRVLELTFLQEPGFKISTGFSPLKCFNIRPSFHAALNHAQSRYHSSETKHKCDVKTKIEEPIKEEEKQLSLLQRFKQMYRDYWYVLLPVHLATSAVWTVGFYYLATSGVDIVAVLESMGASEKIIDHLKTSSTGYFAITYALYKIATPARYTITLGGTTISIKYLKQWGYIKPIPPKEKLKEMYQERRDNLKEKRDNFLKSYRNKDQHDQTKKE